MYSRRKTSRAGSSRGSRAAEATVTGAARAAAASAPSREAGARPRGRADRRDRRTPGPASAGPGGRRLRRRGSRTAHGVDEQRLSRDVPPGEQLEVLVAALVLAVLHDQDALAEFARRRAVGHRDPVGVVDVVDP